MSENVSKNFGFDDFVFETNGNVLFRNGETVALEPSAARVLRFFLENEGRLVSKEEILDTVWAEVFTTEDVLKRAVSQIRRALGDDAKNSRFIETHHRRGYRFVADHKSKRVDESAPEKRKEPKRNENAGAPDPNFDCLVGRAREINFLEAEFRRVLHRTGQPVLIAGAAGIGKTQAAARFARTVAPDAVPLRVRFFDYEAAFLPAYDVFLDLLGEACAMVFGTRADKEEKSELRRTIAEKLKITLPDELFNLGGSAGQTLSNASRAIVPLAESFVRLSRIRPLVLVFDDIQWADETSRQIVGYLMRIAPDAPLMIVGLMRIGEARKPSDVLAGWLEKQALYRSFTTLEFAPLDAEDCRALIGEVFRGALDVSRIPERDLDKLHLATGGNPYFLIETLRLLINENVIERNASGWTWRGLKDVPLPETIRMAARAKFVKLSAPARDLVECAGVLGDSFQIKTLELMLEDSSAGDIENNLDEAIDAQVLTEQNVSGADDCQFYHTTLRRAVYMDLSPRRRKRLHLRAMRAIENSHSTETEKFAGALAAHAENADEFETSLRLYLQACRAAAARFDWLEAAEILARAERAAGKIAAADDARNLELLSLRGEVYMSVGRRAEAEKILARAVALSAEKNASEAAELLLNLGRTRILLGKYRESVPVLEKALALAETDSFIASAAQIQLASAKYALCEYEAAGAILQKIIDGRDADAYNRAVALGKLGWIRALQSRYEEGKILLEEAFRFHQTAGDLRERAVLAMCLNWCEYGTGDYEAAIRYARQARREAQIVGEPYNESVAQMRIAKARIAQGLYDEAEDILGAAWETQKTLDAPHAQAETIWMRGRSFYEKGDFARAADELRTALEMILKVGDRDDEFRILIDQSNLENRLGNFAAALRLAETAATIAAEIGIDEGVGEALTAQARALTNLGEAEKAVNAAREAVRVLEKYSSGERWRAFFALAAALREKSAEANDSEIETALRGAVAILERMRRQFSETEELFFVRFTKAFDRPALQLRDLLNRQNRRSEAAEIARAWLID